jgi:hypothetical protein
VTSAVLQHVPLPNASHHRSDKSHSFDQMTLVEVSWNMAVVREAIEKELRGGGGVGANISRARERMNGLTYGVVRLATRAKADCDDDGVVDGWGGWWGGWWETAMERQAVTQMEE